MPLCSSCGRNTFIPRVAVDLPRLHDRLRNEAGPASVQPDEVTSVLENIQRDLEDYESEIYRLERLRQEKERLEQYATRLRSLLSPFRKVPDEILRRIFDDCCDMNSFRVVHPRNWLPVHTSQALRSKPALVISSVCSRWRRNALSMPVIWSRISLYWDIQAAEYCKDEHAEMFFPLSNFLDRSQQCPMTVNLEIDDYPFSTPGVLHPLLEQLFVQIVRWQDFSFDCMEYSFQKLLDCDRIPSAAFLVLSKLCITDYYVDDNDLVPFLDTAPNLQSLRLGDVFDGVPRVLKNYSQLSHLDFCPRWTDIQNLFEICPNLSSLRITELLRDCNAVGSTMIICSSRFETLAVRHGGWPSNSSADRLVFPLLNLPSLKTLHLETCKPEGNVKGRDERTPEWWYFKPFMAFVQRSSFQLTTFSVQQISICDANLVHILVHLPTLQYLTVDNDDIPQEYSPISLDFIESLHSYRFSSLRPQAGSIIPRLRSLRLLNVAAATFNDLSVVEMVQSRWSPTGLHKVGTSALEVDCLRVFTMTFRNRSEADAGAVYSSLAPIERDGMMIVVQMLGQAGQ
ncbi:hypothetical protein BDP27DRAFT_1340957 [Rhodocollybia butyracea]|uniref:F-box domain-containing protein n=1 Tax=Rhodocollybia butyracea TaxID=206335 RepID=A0A9P5TYD4_9AGAR|nr:hypothetical protein BDP27DRAFT_1340957 [Rhodocollybia butyracea]